MFPPTNRINKLELCLYESGISMNGFEALLVYPVVGKTAIYLTRMSYFILKMPIATSVMFTSIVPC
jgi:hypothetical protein